MKKFTTEHTESTEERKKILMSSSVLSVCSVVNVFFPSQSIVNA